MWDSHYSEPAKYHSNSIRKSLKFLNSLGDNLDPLEAGLSLTKLLFRGGLATK